MYTKPKVMRNTKAPVVGKQPFGEIEFGFMRDLSGRIFFLKTWGRETVPFPVLEDGRISKHGAMGALEFPTTTITLVHPKELGITEIRWADEEADLFSA